MADNPLRNLLVAKGIITQAELRAHDGDDVNEALKREFEHSVNTVLADLRDGRLVQSWEEFAKRPYSAADFVREAFRRWELEEQKGAADEPH